MKKLIFILFFLVILFPFVSKAGGLVPCGGPDEAPCTACDLFVLADNILHFALIGSFSIVVIFAIYAGIRLILSGGIEANIKTAQQTLSSALIGLLIILCAWLIINTFFWLIAKIGGDDYTGTWWHLECNSQSSSFNSNFNKYYNFQLL